MLAAALKLGKLMALRSYASAKPTRANITNSYQQKVVSYPQSGSFGEPGLEVIASRARGWRPDLQADQTGALTAQRMRASNSGQNVRDVDRHPTRPRRVGVPVAEAVRDRVKRELMGADTDLQRNAAPAKPSVGTWHEVTADLRYVNLSGPP